MPANRPIRQRNKTGEGTISDNRQKHLSDFFFMSDKTSWLQRGEKISRLKALT